MNGAKGGGYDQLQTSQMEAYGAHARPFVIAVPVVASPRNANGSMPVGKKA